MNTQVLGISCDSQYALNAFAMSLGGLPFPLVTDFSPKGELAKAYEIWQGTPERGHNVRACFIVDAEGVIRFTEAYEPGSLPELPKLIAELSKMGP